MNSKIFANPAKIFSVVLFIQEDTFKTMRAELERVGNQRNVKFVIQPCPYEGIEFLYQVPLAIPHSLVSEDKELFWHALELKRTVTPAILEKISAHHHQFLVSILQNDSKLVEKERKELESLIQKTPSHRATRCRRLRKAQCGACSVHAIADYIYCTASSAAKQMGEANFSNGSGRQNHIAGSGANVDSFRKIGHSEFGRYAFSEKYANR